MVKPYGFIPASSTDADLMSCFRMGSNIKATVTRERSPALLRFYWALISKVAHGIGYDKEALSHDILISARRVDSYLLSNGWTRVRAQRISKMDQLTFADYVREAIEIILRDYLPEMKRQDLLDDVEQMVGVTYDRAHAEHIKGAKRGRSEQKAA